MDFIFHTKENVVISSHHKPATDNPEYEMRDIDMDSKDAVKNERARITELMGRYKYFETPRAPVDVEDYRTENSFDRDGYKKAKEDWRKQYVKERQQLAAVARKLDQQNTYLCQKSKEEQDAEAIKNGTFYNADELEVLDDVKKKRQQQLRDASNRHYEKNKNKIQIKRKLKMLNEKLEDMDNKEFNQKLVKTMIIIKPQCLCGCAVNVTKLKDIKTHSKLVKHQLFKSIIKLVHYKRRQRKLINVVGEVNKCLADGKRLERFKRDDGEWGTKMERPNKDTIIYFNDQCVRFDESSIPKPRPSTQNKKEYTKNYKDNRLILACQTTAKKGRPKES